MSLPAVRPVDIDTEDPLDFLVENTNGTLLDLDLCEWRRVGECLAGTITLEIVSGSVNTGADTCSIRTVADHSTHPRSYPDDDVFTGVLLDGSTEYDNIVPDARLVFKSRDVVGTVDTWTSTVTFGSHLGTYQDGNPDAETPGDPVLEARQAIKNFDSTLKTGVGVSIDRPVPVLWRKAGKGCFASIRVSSDEPVEREEVGTLRTLPYKFSCANSEVSPGRIDILMHTTGSPAAITTVRDLDASPTTTSDSLQLLKGNRYRIESGALSGLEFTVHATATNADTCNVQIQDRRCIEIAADNSGSPAAYGSDDVMFSSLDPDEVGYYWVRVSANVGSGEKNPLQISPRVYWLNTGVTAIEEA